MHRFRNGFARSPIMEGILLVLLLFTKILFFLKNSGAFLRGNQPPSVWISDYLSSSFIIIIGCCCCCCDDGGGGVEGGGGGGGGKSAIA